MIIIPLQYEKHSGPNAIGQHNFVFSMDESIDMGNDFKALITSKKGTQFLVSFVECGTPDAEEFASETPEDTLKRFKKHFEALVSDVARLKNISHEEYRTQVKSYLINNGIIKDSTSEMSIEDYAKVIVRLRDIKMTLIGKI